MILQSLVKYYDILYEEGKVPRFGWNFEKVSYAINLDENGKVKGFISLKTKKIIKKKKDKEEEVYIPKAMIVPNHFTRSGKNPPAYFLCDNAKFLLGIGADGSEELQRFNTSKELHLKLLDGIDTPFAKAICNFYKTWNPKEVKNSGIIDDFKDFEKGTLIFSYGNEFANENDILKNVWNKYLKDSNSEKSSLTGVCSVTGEYDEIASVHSKIKNVLGGHTSGTSFVSFNCPATESYNMKQSYNSSVGKTAEFKYSTALNYLLSKNNCKIEVGNTTIIFWAESKEEKYQNVVISSIDPQKDNQKELSDLFEKIKYGRHIDVDDVELNLEQKFYILGVVPNDARLSAQFFYKNSFGNILKNIAKHYERLNMVKPTYIDEDKKYLSVNSLLYSSGNTNAKDNSSAKLYSTLAASMIKSIIFDTCYPERLYTDVLRRIKAECGNVGWVRASFIKAFLTKNRNLEGDDFVGLNEECNETSYLLGRLFSVLESAQLDSMGKNITSIKDKYFGSACTTPNLIFPMILKLNVNHMKKLDRDNKNKKVYYEKIMMSIMDKIDIEKGFPVLHTLDEQGKFVLGYYHQTQVKYEKSKEKNENKGE